MRLNNPDYLVFIKQAASNGGPGVTVVAPLPETSAYDTSSEYATPFAQGMLSNGNASTALSALGIRVTTQAMTAQLWQGATDNNISLDLEFQTYDDPDADVRQPVLALLKLAAASVGATGLLTSPGPHLDLADTGDLITTSAKTLWNETKQIGGALGAVAGISQAIRTDLGLNAQTDNLNSNQKSNTPPNVESGLGVEYWKRRVRNNISVQLGRYAFFDSVVILSASETWSNQIDARTGLPLHAKVSLQFKPLFLVTQADLDKIFGGAQ
jgi:hypothetical protein